MPPTTTSDINQAASIHTLLSALDMLQSAVEIMAPNANGDQHNYLSSGARAGVITSVCIFFLFFCVVLAEFGFMRKKRRERALRRAEEGVEQGGGGMDRAVGSEGDEGKENMVLESRVEIVVDEESNSEGDGWEADMEGEDESDGETGRGRGRHAMSLSRREYR